MPERLKPMLRGVRDLMVDSYVTKSYSQEGEDIVLRRVFAGRERGFYVDIGAHHPRRYSNTYYFYRQGWRGINVEPSGDAIRLFRAQRPRDINLQLGISDRPQTLTYYAFDDGALNTFDGELVKWRLANTEYKVTGTIEIPVERLDAVLAKHLPPGQEVDFLSIDVEGLDLAVVRSNDWTRVRPKCVLAEAIGASLDDAIDSDLYRFLIGQGYGLFAKTFNTLFFRERAAGP